MNKSELVTKGQMTDILNAMVLEFKRMSEEVLKELAMHVATLDKHRDQIHSLECYSRDHGNQMEKIEKRLDKLELFDKEINKEILKSIKGETNHANNR